MRIGIVGTGISGLTAAHLLSTDHDLVVYEADNRIGGHTHTVDVDLAGAQWAVDTGFIVFNERTYTNFLRLMRRLDVAWQPSEMSFSVHNEATGLFYKPSDANTLFAQRKNLLNPVFYRMIVDLIRFRRALYQLLAVGDDTTTLADYLAQNRYSRMFIDSFIIPMGASIWSTDPTTFQTFPIRYLAEFYANHGFLEIKQPKWLVLKGGSRQYLAPITRPFNDAIRLNAPVTAIKRFDDRVTITTADGTTDTVDQVIVAAHSDQALAMLADPSEAESQILSAIDYQANETVLHTDTGVLPPDKRAWASWNYRIPRQPSAGVTLTYNMNRLQRLTAPEELCVSLNMGKTIAPDRIIRTFDYAHPVYTPASLAARRQWKSINGIRRTYFCGAYWGYGFHEDGVKSALAVTREFGKDLS